MCELNVTAENVSLFRRLFNGRQDIFAERKKEFLQSDGKKVSNPYFPVCRTINGMRDNTAYVPLSDTHIEHYLKGEIEISIYLLKKDYTVNFAAIDFDNNHTFFEDVIRTANYIESMGVKAHISRSTRKGHHVYIFFSEPVNANYCSAFFNYLFEELGFKEELRNGTRKLPERFPRRVYNTSSDKITHGHCIKPPLWGKGLSATEMRNCFVNEIDKPFLNQWEIANNIDKKGRQDSNKFIQICNNNTYIKKYLDQEIENQKNSFEKQDYQVKGKKNYFTSPPQGSSFNKILSQCSAMKEIWEKKPSLISHEERVAALASAIHCEDGLNIIREKWKSHETERQIKYAINTNQSPWTCRAMQDYSFCKSDCGLKKRPPTEVVNGKVVINPKNIPESQWKEPSNYRLAFSLNEKDVETIKKEIDNLKNKKGTELTNSVESILENISQYKKTKFNYYNELMEYLKSKKYIKKSDIKESTFNNFEKSIKDNINSNKLVKYIDSYIGETNFSYFEEKVDKNGEIVRVYFTDFKIIFDENELVYGLDTSEPISNEYSGRIIFKDTEFPIKLKSHEIDDKKLFMKRFRDSCGFYSKEMNILLHQKVIFAATNFGTKGLNKTIKSTIYGMVLDQDKKPKFYKSQDLVITAKEIYRDNKNIVDLSSQGECNAKYLRLINSDDNQFNDLSHFIVNCVLKTHDASITYTCFAHSMQAFIHNALLPLKERPILWLFGLTGSGKTYLTDIYASFHGESHLLAHKCTSTTNSLFKASNDFKDALLVIDDYKSQDPRGMLNLIQTIFDGKSRSTLKQNGEMRTPIKSQCLAMVSAEDLLTSESSAIARQIILQVDRCKNYNNQSFSILEEKIKNRLKEFPIFSTRFIQYCLGLEKEYIENKYRDIYLYLLSKTDINAQNRERIAKNISANITTFELITEFLCVNQIIDSNKKNDMNSIHLNNLSVVYHRMLLHCKDEQASNVFLTTLKELISTDSYYIEGLNTNKYDSELQNRYSKKIGFTRDDKIYIFPRYATDSVKLLLNKRGEGINHTTNTIGEQLKNDGFLLKTDTNRTQTKVSYHGSPVWVWAISREKFNEESKN